MLTLNSAYIDEMYADFLRDPDYVDANWKSYFQNYSSSENEIRNSLNGSTVNVVQSSGSQNGSSSGGN
ncbi:MAG: hypothetical protein HYZ54_13810, partial [Ignavibacteriae bacterium]|nr:hypothetical protein [Ignavibacteriota bacterium]